MTTINNADTFYDRACKHLAALDAQALKHNPDAFETLLAIDVCAMGIRDIIRAIKCGR